MFNKDLNIVYYLKWHNERPNILCFVPHEIHTLNQCKIVHYGQATHTVPNQEVQPLHPRTLYLERKAASWPVLSTSILTLTNVGSLQEYAGILMLMADLTSSLSPVSELTTQLDLLWKKKGRKGEGWQEKRDWKWVKDCALL